MKKILKTSIPPVCTYPGATNLFSILWNNPEKVMPWICDHYIQIALSTGNMLLNFIEFLKDFSLEHPNYADTPYSYAVHIDWDLQSTDVIGFFKNCIDHDYYIKATLDRYYFSTCSEYMRQHYLHQLFIFGYDTDFSVMYGADFFDRKPYADITIPMEEIRTSFVHGVKKEDFHLLKLRDDKHAEGYRTDIELLRASLEDYLLSKNTVYKFDYYPAQRGYDIIFGLECYNYICELPIDRLDVRAFHLLWSNKILMSLRIKYLSHMYSHVDDNLINFCDKIAAELLLVRNMVLKCRFCPDEQLHRRISNKMKEIQEKDRIFISRLLEILK